MQLVRVLILLLCLGSLASSCATVVLPGAVVNQYVIVKIPVAGGSQDIKEDIDLSDLGKNNQQQGGKTDVRIP